VRPVHGGDLPLVDAHVAAAQGVHGSLTHVLDTLGGRRHGFGGVPAGGDDAAAGFAVDQHRQADTAGHALYGRHDLVPDVADAVVHALRVGGEGGGTGVHAALLSDGGRRPCGVAALAIVLATTAAA
jgi:hypothetical protein